MASNIPHHASSKQAPRHPSTQALKLSNTQPKYPNQCTFWPPSPSAFIPHTVSSSTPAQMMKPCDRLNAIGVHHHSLQMDFWLAVVSSDGHHQERLTPISVLQQRTSQERCSLDARYSTLDITFFGPRCTFLRCDSLLESLLSLDEILCPQNHLQLSITICLILVVLTFAVPKDEASLKKDLFRKGSGTSLTKDPWDHCSTA